MNEICFTVVLYISTLRIYATEAMEKIWQLKNSQAGKKSFTSLIGGLLVKDLTVVGGGGFIDLNLPHKG